MTGSLRVHSIFRSIQGESTFAGLPCAFVRLAGCPLRCAWCDTRDAAEAAGTETTVEDAASLALGFEPRLVEVTGGEPLAQAATLDLVRVLCSSGATVLVETSGAFDTSGLDPRARVVLDHKCPSSGMSDRMIASNLDALRPGLDEVKFVIADREDFEFAVRVCLERDLLRRAAILVSPVDGRVDPRDLAEWILGTRLPLRLQARLHKILWGEEAGRR